MDEKVFQSDYRYPMLVVIATYEFRRWLTVFPFDEGQYLSSITEIPKSGLFAYEFEGGGNIITPAQEQFLDFNEEV